MKKALLPLLIASALPAAAFADVTVYGKANVAFQNADLENGGTYTELVSNASRIGLKGSDAISDDFKAIYQFEYETAADTGTNSNGQTFAQRNIYVGLQSVGGTVMLGMFDTPLKAVQEKVDLFNDLIGDMKFVIQGETRATNVVQYSTPVFSNFTGTVAYVNSEVDAADTGDGYSASIAYNTKTIYLALANDHNVSNAIAKTPFTLDTDILRAVGRFVIGPVQLGALYETYDNGVTDEDGYLLSAQWNLDAKFALKAQFAQSDMKTTGGETESLGLDYKYSKNTKVFGYISQNKDDNSLPAKKHDDKYLGVGIELNF